MEVGDSGNVPGVTNQGAKAEATRVVGEVGDDHFNDLVGKPGDRGRGHRGGRRRGTPRTRPLDLGFIWITESVGEQLDRCSGTSHDQMEG